MKKSKQFYWYITLISTIIILIIGYGITPGISKIHRKSLFSPKEKVININQKKDVVFNDYLLYPWNLYDTNYQKKITDLNNNIINYWNNEKVTILLSTIATNHGIDIKNTDEGIYNRDLNFYFKNYFLSETIPKITVTEYDTDDNTYNASYGSYGKYYDNYYFKGEYNNENISYNIRDCFIKYFSIDIEEEYENQSENVVELKIKIKDDNTIVKNYINKIFAAYSRVNISFPLNISVNDFDNNLPDYAVIDHRINVIYHFENGYVILFYSNEKNDFVGYSCLV